MSYSIDAETFDFIIRPTLGNENFLGLFWEIKFENGHVEVIRDISVLVVFIQDADKFIRQVYLHGSIRLRPILENNFLVFEFSLR